MHELFLYLPTNLPQMNHKSGADSIINLVLKSIAAKATVYTRDIVE